MADTYEIVKNIKQAAMNAKDWPEGYDANEEDVDFMKREEGDKITDSRRIDGFDARINGDILTVTYQTETTMQEAHENDFEDDIRRTLNDIKTYLQREYANLTEGNISLEPMGDPHIELKYISNVRQQVNASRHYRIPSLDPVEDEEASEKEQNVDELDTLLRECRQKAGLE